MIQTIEDFPSRLKKLVDQYGATNLDTPYREFGWTVRQVVHHVADSHMNAYIRFKLALTEDKPTIKPYNEKAWAEMIDSKTLPVDISLTLLTAIHKRWVTILRTMNEESFQRTFFHPEHMKLHQMFDAGGALHDARDVVVASTNASLFAYVADGHDGLKVLQLTSPSTQPKFYGFSPEPRPQLIAHYATRKPALALSKGLDRDRGVDETGHQIAIFGRIGSRPLTLEEMERLYLDSERKPWFVKPQ